MVRKGEKVVTSIKLHIAFYEKKFANLVSKIPFFSSRKNKKSILQINRVAEYAMPSCIG